MALNVEMALKIEMAMNDETSNLLVKPSVHTIYSLNLHHRN